MSNIIIDKKKEKDWRVLEFYVPISEQLENDKGDFVIKGVAINETTTLNNVKYVAEELIKAASSFRNVPILLDHKNEIRNIVGRTTENVHWNSTFNRIDFEAKIMDKGIKEMIKDGRINSVSIGAKVEDLTEEEDGSKKAIGIKGLELSLVAVPGDSQANLAQAIQSGFVLKEQANLMAREDIDTQTKKEDCNMTETETKVVPEESEKEVVAPVEEPVKEEPTEEVESPQEVATESVQKIDVKIDTSEMAAMKAQIQELKELLISKKEIQKQVVTKETMEDKTKGLVSSKVDEELEKVNSNIVEAMGRGSYAMYKDYSKEDSSTNLKRLVR